MPHSWRDLKSNSPNWPEQPGGTCGALCPPFPALCFPGCLPARTELCSPLGLRGRFLPVGRCPLGSPEENEKPVGDTLRMAATSSLCESLQERLSAQTSVRVWAIPREGRDTMEHLSAPQPSLPLPLGPSSERFIAMRPSCHRAAKNSNLGFN